MKTLLRYHPLLAGSLLGLLLTAGGLPARVLAGESCATSRAANALLGCDHCQAMKKLLSEDAVVRMSLSVHDFARGVLIEVHAANEQDRDYISRFVDEMWTRQDHDSRRLSESCEARYARLDRIRVETAPTDDGVFLILTADEPSDVEWLQDDASSTREYVLAASTN